MESFAQLKRRTTDLFQSLPQSLPSVPSVNINIKKPAATAAPGMKASWEKIDDIPPLPLSSHSINVVNGSAFIFGGDTAPGRPVVDNDMHVLVLPYNSAGADYYKIKAAPPRTYTPLPEEMQEEPAVSAAAAAVPEASSEAEAEAEVDVEVEGKGKGKEKEKESSAPLDDVSLASPTTGADPSFDDDDEEEPEITPTTSASLKGKQPEQPPSPSSLLPDVPGPRAGHATAVVGQRIFLFGGRDPESGQAINEHGRVWVYDTRNHAWSFLDPVPPAPGVTLSPLPGPRHGHAAASTDRPRDFAPRGGPKRTQSWKQWASGDSADVGIPQAPIVGNLALKARDEEDDGYGTFFVHGGIVTPSSRSSTDTPTSPSAKRSSDLWAFDIRTRVWTELPAAPGPARDGASLCISKSRLFRYGGSDGTSPLGGQLDFLHLEIESFDDGIARGEVSVRARDGWQTIAAGATPESLAAEGKPAETEIPLVGAQDWPSPRAFSSFQAVTNGAGREFLVLIGGDGPDDEPADRGREGRTRALRGDAWAFQVPPVGMSVASLGGAFWQAIGQPTGEGRWTRLDLAPYDEDEQGAPPAVARAWAAASHMGELEEAGVVVWGGVGETGRRLGDGWILRLA